MTLQVFTRTSPLRNPVASVRVVKKGSQFTQLKFNAMATRELGPDVEALRLFSDQSAGEIGFQPTNFEDPNGYALAHTGCNAWVTCPGFIHQVGLQPGASWAITRRGDLYVAIYRPEVA